MKPLVIFAIFLSFVLAKQVEAEPFVFDGKPSEFEEYGYFLRRVEWPFQEGERMIINVCWETLDPAFVSERTLVRQAIAGTWEAVSKLEFWGWQACVTNNQGIRIAISRFHRF